MQNKVYFEIFTFLFFIEMKTAVYKTTEINSGSRTYFLKNVRLPFTDKNYIELQCNNKNITGINKTLTAPSTVQTGNNINIDNRKQYEMINILLRGTKIFIERDGHTETYLQKNKNHPRFATVTFIQHRNPYRFRTWTYTSTPSYIEFYYLQELDEYVENGNRDTYSNKKGPKLTIHQTDGPAIIQYNNISELYDPSKLKTSKLSGTNTQIKGEVVALRVKTTQCIKNSCNKKSNIVTQDFFDSMNCTNIDNLKLNKEENNLKSTTFYDKIRFFEIHDNQTQLPAIEKKLQNSYNNTSQTKYILLDHIRNDIGHVDNKTRHYVKKHIVENQHTETTQGNEKVTVNLLNSTRSGLSLNLWLENKEYTNKMTEPFQVKYEAKSFLNYINKPTVWTEYPFIAVYIYKPLQIYCDAAGISPHWLMASASCLSRHGGNLVGGGQSAFVTYCGNTWWLPERVAYVKYTLIHPRYHPRDRIRRQLYNIGVIKIVTSMTSACPGWAPIPIMSHQFTAKPDGSNALAIGWGLDRYDARYTPTELPKRPLVSYESLVHFESCPGDFEYSRGKKNRDIDVGFKNLFCLSLPPYNGEDNDPVHGGLLLAEGKLIALYLQEQRRPWGEQSAQYTGTWRLIPWIFDVAQESDATDTFTIPV